MTAVRRTAGRRTYARVADRIYRDSRTGNFYERPLINGRRTWRKLDGHTLKLARESLAQRRTDVTRSKLGLARSPYAPKPQPISEVLDAYAAANCPDRRGVPRTGYALHHELARISLLRPYWSHLTDVHPQTDPRRYFAHRSKTRRNKAAHGGRAVDLELATLGNAFAHAVREGKLLINPLAERPRFQTQPVRHCRDCAPRNADELHLLAAHFFKSADCRTVLLGWQLLLEAFTGCRTSEILRLRWNATNHEPGHIEDCREVEFGITKFKDEGKSGERGQPLQKRIEKCNAPVLDSNSPGWLWLNRSKSGCNPFALIHPALRDCLTAFAAWRARQPRLARCPEMFPIHKQSLAHALRKLTPLLLDHPVTSHGLRSYYVTVRRSQGASDAQIAAEIGDRSGPAIIASTYGAIPPNWQGSPGLDWLPKDAPAWTFVGTPPSSKRGSVTTRRIPSGIPFHRSQRTPQPKAKQAIC